MRDQSTVARTASILREEILASADAGRFIGYEEDLLARLSVSRATLRQAARVLEQEQLLTVKRGVGGGFYARRPTTEAVAHIASIYLRAEGVDLTDLQQTYALVMTENLRLAASNPSPRVRGRLVEFVDEYQARLRNDEPHWFPTVALEFGHLVADVAGSPSLSLFESVLRELAMKPLGGKLLSDPAKINTTRRFHRRLAEAVYAGDVDAAVQAFGEFDRQVRRWIATLSKTRVLTEAAG
jgi:DNA-binding FadR family transcriptional regulator